MNSIVEPCTVGDVRRIAVIQAETVKDRRTIAAAVFVFLSGLKVNEFLSTNIADVSIGLRMVVNPKNNHVYRLLDIPDLLDVVGRWDQYVRSSMPKNTPWYASVNKYGALTAADATAKTVSERRFQLSKNLHAVCAAAGVPFVPTEKLRRGGYKYANLVELGRKQRSAVLEECGYSRIYTGGDPK